MALRGGRLTALECLVGGYWVSWRQVAKKMEPGFSQQCVVGGQEATGMSWKKGANWLWRLLFWPQGQWDSGASCLLSLCRIHSWRFSRPIQKYPSQSRLERVPQVGLASQVVGQPCSKVHRKDAAPWREKHLYKHNSLCESCSRNNPEKFKSFDSGSIPTHGHRNLLRWAVSLGCSLLDPAATFQKSGIEWGSLPLDPLTLSECREGKWELACRMQKGTVLSSPVLLITGGDPLFSYKKVGKGEKKVKLESLSFSAVRWATRCANWRLSIWD